MIFISKDTLCQILALCTFQSTLALLQLSMCGLGTLPFERVSVQHPTKSKAFCISSPSPLHFITWLIPLDLQITQGDICKSAWQWPDCCGSSQISLTWRIKRVSLCLYGAVLFSSRFLLFMRHKGNYNLRVVCLQQGEMYFGLVYLYNLYIYQKLYVVGWGWTWLRHLNFCKGRSGHKFMEHQGKFLQTQMFQEIKLTFRSVKTAEFVLKPN